jgi:hypothetical protein
MITPRLKPANSGMAMETIPACDSIVLMVIVTWLRQHLVTFPPVSSPQLWPLRLPLASKIPETKLLSVV